MIHRFDNLISSSLQTWYLGHCDGTPLIACSSCFVPYELLRAAGANAWLFPVGGDYQAAQAALKYTIPCINPLARSMVGDAVINGKSKVSSADMIAFAVISDHGSRMAEMLEYLNFPVCKVGVPSDRNKELAFNYYVSSLRRLFGEVEKLTGVPFSPEKAREQILLSNRLNAVFCMLDEQRKQDTLTVRFAEYMRLQHLSMYADCSRRAEKIEEFAGELCNAAPFPADAPRLMFIGHAVAPGDYVVPELLDELECPVVVQLLDDMIRSCDCDIDPEGDPIESFAKAQWSKQPPISLFNPSWKQRMEWIRSKAEEYRVDGVVWYQLDNDEIYDMEFSGIEKFLSGIDLPVVKLVTDYDYSPKNISQYKLKLSQFVKAANRHHTQSK